MTTPTRILLALCMVSLASTVVLAFCNPVGRQRQPRSILTRGSINQSQRSPLPQKLSPCPPWDNKGVILEASTAANENSDDHKATAHYKPLSLTSKILQPLQLALTIWLLLLLPAGLFASRWNMNALGIMPHQYLLLFGLGTLPRQWRFGKQYSNDTKSQAKRGTKKRDFALFQLVLFACHWVGVWNFACNLGNHGKLLVPVWQLSWSRGNVGVLLLDLTRWFAVGFNAWAAWTLGRAYDRVTTPNNLVTTGPYSVVRHPIYTSYLLLFGSGLLSLGSLVAFLGLVVGATCFYSGRMNAEDELLQQAFGQDWDDYVKRVPKRLFPWIL